MFANAQKGGLDLAFPDVCLTPSGGPPVPVPYPNTAMGPTAVGFVAHVFFSGTPAHNLQTSIPLTMGDNAGVATGVASGTVMSSCRHVTAANTVLVGGAPASRLTSVTQQNSTNSIGARIAPSQTTVLLLAP